MARVRARGVGTRIRHLRKRLGWTQATLAGERLSKSYISQIETGRVRPSARALAYIAERLGKAPESLLQEEDVQPKIRSLISGVQVCLRRREYEEAGARLREAAALALNTDDSLQLAQVHDCAGHLYVTTGCYDDAVAAFREATAIYRTTGSLDRIASIHCSLANTLMLQGKLPAADVEVKAAQEIYRHGLAPDHLILGRSYLVAGNIASASGRHEAAQLLFEQALSLLRGRDILGTGETYASAGISLLLSGNPGAAVAPLRDALKLLGEVSDLPSLAVIARFLAEAVSRSSDPERAMAEVRHAGSLAYQLRDRLGVGWAAVRLAELGLAKGDVSTAEEAAAEAGSLLGAGQPELAGDEPVQSGPQPEIRRDWDVVLRARTAYVRASLARLAGRDEESLEELKGAARLLGGIYRAVPLYVLICRELGARLRSLGRLAEALECLSEALDGIVNCHVSSDPVLSVMELAALPSPLWFRT